MKKLFEKTKYTKWYVNEDGKVTSISSYGRCLSEMTKKATLNKKRGYLYVRTSLGNYSVHRLVAENFIPNPNNKPCVNHKDSNRLNNHVSNLEWVTFKENLSHAVLNGRMKFQDKNSGWNLKYSNEVCRKVLRRIDMGMTYIQAGSKYNMPYSTVAHLKRGSRRRI